MSVSSSAVFIDADEATRRLRVSRATLYAYVSRGLIRSERQAGTGRTHLYALDDVERLIWRKTRARKPAAAAATALSWGLPVLATSLSRIERGALTYRGRAINELAESAMFEEVAVLLWNLTENPFEEARFDTAQVAGWEQLAGPLERDDAVDRAIALMALLRREPWTKSCSALPGQSEAKLVQALAHAATGLRLDTARPLHLALAEAWNAPDGADIIRRGLVCSADHELNTSAFAARVVASAHVDYGTALLAALAAFCSSEHIGVISRSRRLLAASRAGKSIPDLIAEMEADHEPFACFYHRLYPDGDPRAGLILDHCRAVPEAERIIDGVWRQKKLRPNIGFALIVAEVAHGFPTGSAEAIFMIGRAAGWIAHAAEQRASGIWIRPRAAQVEAPL